ncbi:MAG TPA: peptidylprolyl isomerase [Polyangiaceae bacterium]|jgi:hypothetical protein|nr:peptidylprolyl isomerase [Polyangiaceae bacterium]
MISRRALTLSLSLSLASMAACACASHAELDRERRGVPANIVAVVGDDVIDVATVARIAAAERITPAVAADRAVSDALVAAEGRRRYGDAHARQAHRGALARTLLRSFVDDARAKGPPTDDEVARETERRWRELDRPRLVRTTHAVVLVKEPGEEARAKTLIAKIAERVAGIADPLKFKDAARSVPAEGLDVRVEDLPPLTPDGVEVDPTEPPPPEEHVFLKSYVDGAFAIPAVGMQSPVVHTSYGYHVILAVEWFPEHRVPLEERRALVESDIVTLRAKALYEAALEHARTLDVVALERSAVDSMLHVQTAP